MRRPAAALTWLGCVLVGAPAVAACPDLHDIEDMVSAGFSSRVIRNVFEETGWPVCLSREDIDRLRRRGLEEDVVAFLGERAQQAVAPGEPEEAEIVPYARAAPSPYAVGYPYAAVYPYGYGGLFFGGAGFHHHHHHDHDFAGHHWAGLHDEGDHAGLGTTGFHEGSFSAGDFGAHAGAHLGGHGAHAAGGHGGHAGHGGHGGGGHGGGGHGGH